MRIIDCIQGSPEWLEARRGIPTASQFSRIMTPKTMKMAASAADYAYELAAESICGIQPSYQSDAMVAGSAMEAEALAWWEMETGEVANRIGFAVEDGSRYGCSPDGLVWDSGGVEIKCPTPKVHAKTLYLGEVPAEHLSQIHGCMLVTKTIWWDFVSYCPPLPTFRVLVERSYYTDRLEECIEEFCEFLADVKARLK